jgi:MFS family permease
MSHIKKLMGNNLNVGRVIWFLTLSDIFTWGFATILSSLSGLYIAMRLEENAFMVIGTTITIFFLTRAIFQLPIGIILDKIERDRDEIIALTIGVILMGLPFTLYPLAFEPWQFFLLHFVYGFGTSLNLNSWRKLFAKNLEFGREGVSYGVYETVMSLGAALFSFLAGLMSSQLSHEKFGLVIVVIGFCIMSAGIWSMLLFTVKNRKSDVV